MKYFLPIFFSLSFVFLLMFGISCVYGIIFPLKYQQEIAIASESYEVDPILIASVIKSESGFDANAVSSKGAVGLMQLLPTTAEYLAKKMNYGDYDLYDISDNINLGSYYLSLLIDEFGDERLALCAYNAGPGNVKSWLSDSKYSSDGENLEVIPFSETENYVKKCEQAKKYYNSKRSYFVVE